MQEYLFLIGYYADEVYEAHELQDTDDSTSIIALSMGAGQLRKVNKLTIHINDITRQKLTIDHLD